MKFQPFGYRFEIVSPLDLQEAKKLINSKKKGWFDAKSGPRGWIFGPFLCLWISAFDKHGPMVIGYLANHNLGTKITGRAGSDLNGLLYMTFLISICLFFFAKAIEQDAAAMTRLVAVAIFLVVGFALMIWWGHTDKRQADPLVNFLQSALLPKETASRSTFAAIHTCSLLTSDEEIIRHPAVEDVRDQLQSLALGDFLILERSDEHFMQVAMTDTGYLLEERRGSRHAHLQADLSVFQHPHELIEQALIAYLTGQELPRQIEWSKIKV